LLVALILLFFLTKSAWQDCRAHVERVESGIALQKDVESYLAALERPSMPVVLYCWRFPHPAFALRHGDQHGGGVFKKEIDVAWPHDGMINIGSGYCSLPDDKVTWDYLLLPQSLEDNEREALEPLLRVHRSVAIFGRFILFHQESRTRAISSKERN